MKRIVLFVAGSVLAVGATSQRDGAPQVNTPTKIELPSFDAASLKPANSPYDGGVHLSAGRAQGRAVTIKSLLKAAYAITGHQIVGAPNWVDGDRFDFDARAATDADPSQVRLMIRSLLIERCHLSVRSERRKSSLYAMMIGKAGLTLPEIKPDEPFPKAKRRPSTGALGGAFSEVGTLEDLSDRLSDLRQVDRPVIDETRQPGRYLVAFTWSQGEDFIQTLEEVSGLKLEPRIAMLDYYVVERIEKPSAN